MNPYDFVPLGTPSAKKAAPGHLELPAKGGVIHAKMTTLGPFLIADSQQSSGGLVPFKEGKVIPGSSIKGMLRNLAEIVGGGCLSTSPSLYHQGRFSYQFAKEPRGFEPCSSVGALCVTCRLFGTLLRDSLWKGLVEPGEGEWKGTGRPERVRDLFITVGQPKPTHHAFYTVNNQLRGRKAYFHHPLSLIRTHQAPRAGANQTRQVGALVAGQTYNFTLRHSGLDEESYALLLYALFLEHSADQPPTLAHKLGWGKPMGLGSVHIEPLTIEEVDLRARYRRGGDSATQRYEGAAAVARFRAVTKTIREREDPSMKALRNLLAFQGRETTKWAYPDYTWFQQNSQKSLEDFNKGG